MASLIAGGVDCDVHPAVPHLTSLLPYLNDYWRDQVTTRGMVDLISQSYPQNSPIIGASRLAAGNRQARRKPGGHAAPSARTLPAYARHLQSALRRADGVFGRLQAAFCRALNEWLVKEWLDRN